MFEIPELGQLEIAEKVAALYSKEFGTEPTNLSHWDPSKEFRTKIISYLFLQKYRNAIDYIYSYKLDSRERITKKLGCNGGNRSCLVTPSGTVSMLCVANWIRSQGVRSIEMLCPVYFPIIHHCHLLGIKVNMHYLIRKDGLYYFPNSIKKDLSSKKVLWVTNPVYCTGVGLTENDLSTIREYLEKGIIVICDECLAFSGNELVRRFGHYDAFVGIYSPHKSISVNGVKFSPIVFHEKHLRLFEQWADVLYGGLTISSQIAIEHFLSTQFKRFEAIFQKRVGSILKIIRQQNSEVSGLEFDHDPKGHFISCFFPRLSAELGLDKRFIWSIAKKTATVFIPGIRNHFSKKIGFCFRVNLSRDSQRFRMSLRLLLKSLSDTT